MGTLKGACEMQGAWKKPPSFVSHQEKNVATFLFVEKKLVNIFVSGVRVQIVAVSYATRIIQAANQNRRKFTSHNYYGTRNATRKPAPQRRPERNTIVDSHADARRSYARDSKKRRRYGTRADRSISLRLVRGPDAIAPSA